MTIEPITTKQHFKNIITECIDNYEISSIDYEKPWTDIDPIQPFGFEYQQKEGFHKWLSTKHPSIYNKIVDICNHKPLWQYKDIWCMLDAANTIMSETDTIHLFTDYCFDNPEFLNAVYDDAEEFLTECELDDAYDD